MISPAEMATALARCPRCSGQMYREAVYEYGCLSCGEYIFVQRPRPTIRQQAAASNDTAVSARAPAASPAA